MTLPAGVTGKKVINNKKGERAMAYLDNTSIEIIASGLAYPEGPVYCSDGSILLEEEGVDAEWERLLRLFSEAEVIGVSMPGIKKSIFVFEAQ